MASQGPVGSANGTSDGSGAFGWAGPENTESDDATYATCTVTATVVDAMTDNLQITDFGFSGLSGQLMTGYEVVIDRHSADTDTVVDLEVKLLSGGSAVGDNKAAGGFWPTSDATHTYGAEGDTWGVDLTGDEVMDSSFGVQISALVTAVIPPTNIAFIDQITMKVFFEPAGGPQIALMGVGI